MNRDLKTCLDRIEGLFKRQQRHICCLEKGMMCLNTKLDVMLMRAGPSGPDQPDQSALDTLAAKLKQANDEFEATLKALENPSDQAEA